MNERTFQRLKEQIQTGDERGLTYVFEQTSRYCVRTLIKKTGCSVADAEDLYMDAILIFRENMISGRLVQLSNLQTYVFGICWNLWRNLNHARSKWQKTQNEVERQCMLMMEDENLPFSYENNDHMQTKVRLVQAALNALGEKCRQLLTYVYIEQRPQKEIASIMGFASANVVKVTRHRCYRQWVKQVEDAKSEHHGNR